MKFTSTVFKELPPLEYESDMYASEEKHEHNSARDFVDPLAKGREHFNQAELND